MEKVWYAYLVNGDFLIESVMVVSNAFGTIEGEMKNRLYCVMLFEVPPVSVVKIEIDRKVF
jgi:hypothetical protein